MLLEDLFKKSSSEIDQLVEHLRNTATELGLPFGPRTRTYNSRRAQELGLWAEDEGHGDDFHMEAFKTYFVEGRNLAKHDVLIELAEGVGLSGAAASTILSERTYADRVDKDWNDSRFMGITAVPTFVMGRHKLVGAQSYEQLESLVRFYNVPPR